MKVCAIAVGALAMVITACQEETPVQFTAADTAETRSLFDSTGVDIRSGNFDHWASRFTEDARFHAPNSPPVVGRAALVTWAKTLPPIESFSFGPAEVRGEGNLAYGWSPIYLKFSGLPADTAKQLVVFRRQSNGRWMIEAVAFNTDLPLPGAAPASRSGGGGGKSQ